MSGRGIVTALNMATGVPVWEIEPAMGLLVGGLLAAGIYPIFKSAANSAETDSAKEVLSKAVWTHRDRFQVFHEHKHFKVVQISSNDSLAS